MINPVALTLAISVPDDIVTMTTTPAAALTGTPACTLVIIV